MPDDTSARCRRRCVAPRRATAPRRRSEALSRLELDEVLDGRLGLREAARTPRRYGQKHVGHGEQRGCAGEHCRKPRNPRAPRSPPARAAPAVANARFAPSQRKQTYKKGVDQDESRRRREETTIQIRKNKKEERLQKRRTATVNPNQGGAQGAQRRVVDAARRRLAGEARAHVFGPDLEHDGRLRRG